MVGPVLDDPAWAADAWQPPRGDEPLVLVGLSSTFQSQADCLQRIVVALAGLPVRAVVTTGPAIPARTIVAPPRRSQPAAIARAVERVLREPRFTRAAQALGAGIRREAASGRLLAELESD